MATPQNAEVQKWQNLGFFAARGRQDKPIETKFGSWVCSGTANVALIGKGAGYRTRKCQNLAKIAVFVPGRNKRIQMKFGM